MHTDKLPHWAGRPANRDCRLPSPPRQHQRLIVGIALSAALLAVMAAVYHAEVVAARVGEPFDAIILGPAVTVIELGLIVSILLGGPAAAFARARTIHAVVVLVLRQREPLH